MSNQFSERLVERVALAQSRFAGAEAVLGGEKFCQRAVDLVSNDFFVGHKDVLKDRLIELASYLITSARIEGVRIFEQSKVGLEELGSLAEVVDHRGEISAELFALSSDVGETSTDLALRQGTVCGEVEQVFFLGVEIDQLILKLLAKEPLRGLGVGECGFHSGAHGSDEGGGESDGLVVILDCFLDPVDVGVRGVAPVVLRADAEEVEVLVALATYCSLQNEPLDRPVLESASAAIERALEVVRMHTAPFA